MATQEGEKPFCMERLERHLLKVNGDDISDAKLKQFLLDFAGCFIEQGRRTRELEKQMLVIAQRGCLLADDVPPVEEEDSDMFRDALKWLAKHILPDLIRIAILAAIAWIAYVNGQITPTP